jgi:preprotein translocase subunit YajC
MQPNPNAGMYNLVFMAALIGVWYFLVIRPQSAKQKEHLKMVDGLQKNDEVVTSGGIHATVVNVKEKTLVVRIDENVKMEIDKNAVAYKKK